MSEKDNLEPWRHCIKMAELCEKWAEHLEARGDSDEAAAMRRAAEGQRNKAKQLRPDS